MVAELYRVKRQIAMFKAANVDEDNYKKENNVAKFKMIRYEMSSFIKVNIMMRNNYTQLYGLR